MTINYIRHFCIFFIIGWQLSTIAAPQPSGTQADGQFRKVILVSDKDLNGDDQTEDNLIDPYSHSAITIPGAVAAWEAAGFKIPACAKS
mgnify:CR=1 FL=1